MTTVQITLPDALAQEAASAGLLAPEKMERILRERLRTDRIERMKTSRATLAAEPLAPMTPEEINSEIEAYRSEQRRAACVSARGRLCSRRKAVEQAAKKGKR